MLVAESAPVKEKNRRELFFFYANLEAIKRRRIPAPGSMSAEDEMGPSFGKRWKILSWSLEAPRTQNID